MLFLSGGALEEFLVRHSALIEDGLTLLGRKVWVGRFRVDLLFRDGIGDVLVVELKEGVIKREHVEQIMQYFGSLYNGKPVRLMLIGSRVPPAFRSSLEYHGIEWRELNEETIRQFDEEKKPISIPTKPSETGDFNKPVYPTDLNKTLHAFRVSFPLIAGEGITEESLESWHRARIKAKEKYARLFSQPCLKDLTKDDFESFLYFRNNRAWTNLYRHGKKASDKIGDLKKTIVYLQNESVDIKVRINSVLGGSYYIRGMGKNLATAILQVCDKDDKYGVWNNRTEGGLQKLGRLPRRTYNNGEFYYSINIELNRLKKELNTDLISVDSFMWYVDKSAR
ncbi:endonuclease NucS [Candidatus Bathyarchaeota archaeon]|nr:endonuclease NucS [Candidatus Bathyarchaeota archaeon]